jgi:DNA polymerase III subunit delta
MSHTLHVLDFLANPGDLSAVTVCVLFGQEPFLKQQVHQYLISTWVGNDDQPVVFRENEKKWDDIKWGDIHEELATVSLFGGANSKRLVILQDADKFVSLHRDKLESYVQHPKRTGTLLIEVDSWLSSTRLYKLVDQHGLQIDCRPPEVQQGRDKVPDVARIKPWMIQWAKTRHNIVLESNAANLLLDFTGPVFGMIDQDLAKLALYVPAGGKITADMVHKIVGGWRAQTAFDMIDAATEGQAAAALLQLERLLQAGDHPLAVFGAMSWSLRRYQALLRTVEASERIGKKISPRDAMAANGIKDWPKGTYETLERRLKQLGRDRLRNIYRWLLEIDLALKGSHSNADSARFMLEQLFLKMAERKATPA